LVTSSAARKNRCASKGMLQRVGMAQALILELVFLMEPMSGPRSYRLDAANAGISFCLSQTAGKTVFLIAISYPEVEQICDRVAILVRTIDFCSIDELLGTANIYHVRLKAATWIYSINDRLFDLAGK